MVLLSIYGHKICFLVTKCMQEISNAKVLGLLINTRYRMKLEIQVKTSLMHKKDHGQIQNRMVHITIWSLFTLGPREPKECVFSTHSTCKLALTCWWPEHPLVSISNPCGVDYPTHPVLRSHVCKTELGRPWKYPWLAPLPHPPMANRHCPTIHSPMANNQTGRLPLSTANITEVCRHKWHKPEVCRQ